MLFNSLDYILFLAQAATVVVAVLLILAAMASLGMKRQQQGSLGHLEIRKLNDRLNSLKDSLRQAVLTQAQFKKLHKEDQKKEPVPPEEDQKKEPAPPEEKAKTDVDVPASETEDSAAEKTPSSTIEEA